MNISVIGAGALGKAYGGILQVKGHDVHYLMRSEFKQISEAGYFQLNILEKNSQIKIENPNIYSDAKLLPKSDLIIVCIKTVSNSELKSLLSSCLSQDSTLLILQNGIGNEEYISQFLDETHTLICGISSMGATRKNNIEVDLSFLGELRLAPFHANDFHKLSFIQDLFKGSNLSIDVQVFPNHRSIRWHKLLWNIPFGAFSIIYDQSCDILAFQEPYLSLIKALLKELCLIAKCEGVLIQDEFIDKMLEATRNRGFYMPSTYVDFKLKRPIEKEYMFDNVLSLAEKHKVFCPILILIERFLNEKINSRR